MPTSNSPTVATAVTAATARHSSAMDASDGGLSVDAGSPQRSVGLGRDGILSAPSSDGSDVNSPSLAGTIGAAPPSASSQAGLVTDANPLKRRNADASADYPRRRAMIACEVCRSRKSRCDGTKPKCKLCTELGATCIYREPGIKLDAGDKMILERLGHIENLLQMNLADAISSSSTQQQQQSPRRESSALSTLWPSIAAETSPFVSVVPASTIGTWSSTTNISTMPKVHTNAAMHLLQWPLICDLVTQPYDPQILLRLEMARESLPSLAQTPRIDLSNMAAYITAYFERVNVWYACVNPYTWHNLYGTALANGLREGPESCIVLLVLALGQAGLGGSISRLVPRCDPPGLSYFTAAWALLPAMMTSNSVLAAQCHLLAAVYLFYLVRPLEAWNLLCTTSTKLQLLLMVPDRVPSGQRELTERIYWNALLFESDLLAELDLPHSGIVQLEENVGLPCGFEGRDPTDSQQATTLDSTAAGRDDLWYFLAEIALRRLLNRVSQLLYARDAAASPASLGPIVAELDYQLTQWYDNLPAPLQFSFASVPLADRVQTVLRQRFFACRTIIYRPYILAVLDREQGREQAVMLEPAVRAACHHCLESAVRQLENVTANQDGHMPYLWQAALSFTSQALLVMGASMSPSLADILLSIVPSRAMLDQLMANVVAETARYAILAPSLSLAADIVRQAEARRREYLGG
ncbi:c6 zinc finger domain containing protein [Grosmannia clavigera kw1407]|uniref:C6 zinc finger domain containing protein n=1 Tax=Grosmannia clavigera (strain kw1407 / UAMH 11150) TaxID=655863 RepID=F0XAA5_GROCL|nr:c6 zinc finger domain containing protein [Grosmannia clavigera kw1407]EFX05743.1 c6 zinc finger domain containing protein [Grosmannia clavigera kw1407]